MRLKEIYRPITRELTDVEGILKKSLKSTRYKSILQVNNYLLKGRGKRLRPALVLLSAKASQSKSPIDHKAMASIAAAVELIHMASLIHDDVIDHSYLRYSRSTINSKWGEGISIALGDYLYSIAFELISTCNNMDILQCINSAAKAMCEGEFFQVCERDNPNLLKKHYLIIVKKKTAALFASCCRVGEILVNNDKVIDKGLKKYGLNFGVAFQIADDCLDFIGERRNLGKIPGSDFRMGELTLPMLNLLSSSKDKNRIISLLKQQDKKEAFREIRQRFIDSAAFYKTKQDVSFYVRKAKNGLEVLRDSDFKNSLSNLVEYVGERLEP